MEGLLQPTHLFFLLLILVVIVGLIFLLVREVHQGGDRGGVTSGPQSQPSPEILLALEKINNALERIEHKLEATRKSD